MGLKKIASLLSKVFWCIVESFLSEDGMPVCNALIKNAHIINGNCGISAGPVVTILNIPHSQQSEGAQHEHQAVWR
jgi:hypothetical protein